MKRRRNNPWVIPITKNAPRIPGDESRILALILRSPRPSIEQISRELSVSEEYIRRVMEKHGVDRQNPYPWGPRMKAITVMQPYAHLIIHGAPGHPRKPVENRSWPVWKQWSGAVPTAEHPSVLLIHAGSGRGWWNAAEAYGLQETAVAWGAAIGIAQLVGCVAKSELAAWESRHGEKFRGVSQSEHAQGPWCWIFGEVVPLLRPVPMRGAQGIWEADTSKINPHAPLCPEHQVPFCGCPRIRQVILQAEAADGG